MVLASSGPLVQSCFAKRYPDRSPYPLYAVSNFGSLLALAAFPLMMKTAESQLSPTTYYGHASSLASLMATRPPGQPVRIAVVGLGVGTIASHGREGDLIRFYEIDLAVIRIARDESYFTFLSNSVADVELRQGDARLLLEQEQRAGERQVLTFW
mgnify:CR=1 FL=1